MNPADWLIVVGHHPLDEVDEEDFVSVLQSNSNFDLYLNGHTHTLVQYTIDNKGAYVTSGAGAMVEIPDEVKDERTKVKLEGGEWTTKQHVQTDKTKGIVQTVNENVQPSFVGDTVSHTYDTVFSQKVAGFNLHTFSDDLQQLTTAFIDYNGTVIHSFTTTKGQGYSP